MEFTATAPTSQKVQPRVPGRSRRRPETGETGGSHQRKVDTRVTYHFDNSMSGEALSIIPGGKCAHPTENFTADNSHSRGIGARQGRIVARGPRVEGYLQGAHTIVRKRSERGFDIIH
ncbi:hypothetical protein GCM10027090_06920 [Sinomonas soli]